MWRRVWMWALLLGALAAAEGPTSRMPSPTGRLAFKEYTQEDGLPSASIMDITQAPDGRMWFLTETGALRYDGRHFKSYEAEAGLDVRLPWRVFSDTRGRMVVLDQTGVFFQVGERFQGVEALQKVPLAYGSAWIGGQWLLATRDGRILVGSPEAGFAPLVVPGAARWSRLCATPQGDLWVARGQTLQQRRPDGTWRTWGPSDGLIFGKHEPPNSVPNLITALVVDDLGTTWARSSRHLFRLPRGGERWDDLGHQLPFTASPVMRPGSGDSLLCLTEQGLRQRIGERWYSVGPEQGLRSVPSVFFEDREHNLWVRSGTLKRMLGRGALTTFQTSEGLLVDDVWALHQDRQGRLYAGTAVGVASTDDRGRWHRVPSLPNGYFGAFCEARDGTLYALCSPAGLFAKPPGRADFHALPISAAGGSFQAFHQDRNGLFWIGTMQLGLWKGTITEKGGVFERVEAVPNHPVEYIGAIREDDQGRLWVASSRGIGIRDGETWHWFAAAQGLPKKGVISLTLGPQGRFWALGTGGRKILTGHYEAGRLILEPQHPDALELKETAFTVYRDPHGVLWAGTGGGLYRIEQGKVQHFGIGEGLCGEDTIANAMLMDQAGRLWVCTTNGMACFDPERWGPALPSPDIHLGSLTFGDRELSSTANPQVPFRNRDLKVTFSSLTFLNEKSIQFRARLLGYDRDWQPASAGQLRYPRLSSGTYRLELQARRKGAAWGPPYAIPFTILPAWWQTWWFRTLVGVLSLGAVAGLVAWRTRALHRRALHLEALVQTRTEALAGALGELEEANENLRALSLTDPLTGLRNRRFLTATIDEDVARVLRAYRDPTLEGGIPDHQDLLFLLIDLDHFKRVNDTYGHAAGDQVLMEMRNRLRACVRDSDSLIRWGGEEFLVVGRQLQITEAATLAQRILEAIRSSPFVLDDGQPLPITCSIGWAGLPLLPSHPDLLMWERVLDLADQCLYAVKLSGRNGWIGLTPGLPLPPDASLFQPSNSTPRLEDLVHQGVVKSHTSLPPERPILWHS